MRHATVLFLDFDGVTHPDALPAKSWEHFESLPIIEAVLRRHPAVDVVISSTWRKRESLAELRLHFAHDMRERVVGCTPSLDRAGRQAFCDMHGVTLSEAYRQAEIVAWLHMNRPGAPWVAIDDQAWWFELSCENVLVTNALMGFFDADGQRLHEMLSR